MSDLMTAHERADLDNHITGGGSPGISWDGEEDPGAPIILAWYLLNKTFAPTAAQITEAINNAIEAEGFKSITAIALLKNYFGKSEGMDSDQILAYREFNSGWEAGVESEPLNTSDIRNDGDWATQHFCYLLGHLAGDLAYSLNWATPYEKESDDAELTPDEVNEKRDGTEKIDVEYLSTDSD